MRWTAERMGRWLLVAAAAAIVALAFSGTRDVAAGEGASNGTGPVATLRR